MEMGLRKVEKKVMEEMDSNMDGSLGSIKSEVEG